MLYVNGRFLPEEGPHVSALDRGFTLADGLFETMVASGGRIYRLADHLVRLRNGAALLGLPLSADDLLAEAVKETLRRSGLQNAVLRLTVSRGPVAARGLAFPNPPPAPTVTVRSVAWTPPDPYALVAVRLHTACFPRNERSPLARVKSLAYTEGIIALWEAQATGADDALFRNTRGNLVCATAGNLFLVRQGALPGVARRSVLEVAHEMGIAVKEEPLPYEALAEAEEMFLTNVVRGPYPVAAVDGRPVGRGRYNVTRLLAEGYVRCVVKKE
ncbi:MAG: aminotransferase class IV family protein [Chloroflexi bacterium]|nr:aminotransferase class IV family protein [Chloroflexota bacterium]